MPPPIRADTVYANGEAQLRKKRLKMEIINSRRNDRKLSILEGRSVHEKE